MSHMQQLMAPLAMTLAKTLQPLTWLVFLLEPCLLSTVQSGQSFQNKNLFTLPVWKALPPTILRLKSKLIMVSPPGLALPVTLLLLSFCSLDVFQPQNPLGLLHLLFVPSAWKIPGPDLHMPILPIIQVSAQTFSSQMPPKSTQTEFLFPSLSSPLSIVLFFCVFLKKVLINVQL